ncbi:hypothetical protein BDGGKGIB_00060 [Nodularia sphaerocarpa UHCC 0038]|nr:hypothetical protein BDGGKGIB_00060 [Nodularia sphaerocarpa UHCC 0038]
MTCRWRLARNYHQAYQALYQAAFNSAIHWCGEASKVHPVALSAVKMQSATARNAFVDLNEQVQF